VLVRAGAAISSTAIPGARPSPALMVFSRGHRAALYDSGPARAGPDWPAGRRRGSSDVDISGCRPGGRSGVDDAALRFSWRRARGSGFPSTYRRGCAPQFLHPSAALRHCACRLPCARLCWRTRRGAVYAIRDLRGVAGRVEMIASRATAWAHPSPSNPIPRTIFVADQAGNVTILDRSRAPSCPPCGWRAAGLFGSRNRDIPAHRTVHAPMWVLDASAPIRAWCHSTQRSPAPSAADNGGRQ